MKVFRKYHTLITVLEAHHNFSGIHTKKRHLGIILTLVGFLLYAFYTILFQIEALRYNTENSLFVNFVEFSIFYFFMFLSYLPFCLTRGKKFFICKKTKLVFIRACFAILCLWFYSLSRVWTSDLDNSMLYSTDGFWVVVIMSLLNLKLAKMVKIGAAIAFCGILFTYFFDLNSIRDLVGGMLGTISGFSLAIILLLTRYMVTYDPPLRIGLYNAFLGFVSSFFIAVIIGLITGEWKLPSSNAMAMMMISGFLFALTLFCFLESFYYTESYILGAVSFFLPVFVEVLNWVVNQSILAIPTIIGSIIITTGGLLIIYSSYRQDKKRHRAINYDI